MEHHTALNTKVLVLNKFFMALHVITARRAITLLFRDRAEVISVDNGDYNSYNFESWKEVSAYNAKKLKLNNNNHDGSWLKTFSIPIEIPKIIRLMVYDKFPRNTVRFNKKNVIARDKNRCQYCGKRFPSSELSLDHIFPKSRGGKNSWTNIVTACHKCNKNKGGKTPQEAKLKLVCEPVKPRFTPVLDVNLIPEKFSSWKNFIRNDN